MEFLILFKLSKALLSSFSSPSPLPSSPPSCPPASSSSAEQQDQQIEASKIEIYPQFIASLLESKKFEQVEKLILSNEFTAIFDWVDATNKVIHVAAKYANKRVLEVLAAKGILKDYFIELTGNMTAFDIAVMYDNLDAVEFFLEYGGLVQRRDVNRVLGMRLSNRNARLFGNSKLPCTGQLFLMIKRGLLRSSEQVVSYFDVMYKNDRLMKEFLAQCKRNPFPPSEFTEKDIEKMIDRCLGNRFNPTSIEYFRKLPFIEPHSQLLFVQICIWAPKQDRRLVIDSMLDEDPTLVLCEDDRGFTALYYLVDLIDDLMDRYKYDSDIVNMQSSTGDTLVHHVSNEVEKLSKLVNYHPDFSIQNRDGVSPMHLIFRGYYSLKEKVLLATDNFTNPAAKRLILTLKDKRGKAPIHELFERHSSSVLQQLEWLTPVLGATVLLEAAFSKWTAAESFLTIAYYLSQQGADTSIARQPESFALVIECFPGDACRLVQEFGALLPREFPDALFKKRYQLDTMVNLIPKYSVLPIEVLAKCLRHRHQFKIRNSEQEFNSKLSVQLIADRVKDINELVQLNSTTTMTMLELAVKLGDEEATGVIVSNKTFDRCHERYVNLLCRAITTSTCDTVHVLLQSGAFPALTEPQQVDALNLLLNKNNLEMLDMCLWLRVINHQLAKKLIGSRVYSLHEEDVVFLARLFTKEEWRQLKYTEPRFSKALNSFLNRPTSVYPGYWTKVAALLEYGASWKPPTVRAVASLPSKIIEQLMIHGYAKTVLHECRAKTTSFLAVDKIEVMVRFIPDAAYSLPKQKLNAVQLEKITMLTQTYKKGSHSNLQYHKMLSIIQYNDVTIQPQL